MAKAEGHAPAVKYLQGKAKVAPKPAAGSYNATTDRNRITATRNDGVDEPDMPLGAVRSAPQTIRVLPGVLLNHAARPGEPIQPYVSTRCFLASQARHAQARRGRRR